MAETLQNLALGFSIALTPDVFLFAVGGCVIGTLVGMLPGVGPLAGISLLLPVTFGLQPTTAMVLLAGIYYGAMYGGSITSILLRLPGDASSAVTVVEGYPMAQQGRAGTALVIPFPDYQSVRDVCIHSPDRPDTLPCLGMIIARPAFASRTV